MLIRPGRDGDFDVTLALMDEAIAWLTAQGRSDQWGSEPINADPAKVDFMRRVLEPGEIFVAEIEGAPAGVLAISETPIFYIPPIDERELFIILLVTSRRLKGAGIGRQLITFAREEAARRDIALIRVDCHVSEDEKLIRFYEDAGFVRSYRIDEDEVRATQVLEMRLDRAG